MPGHQTPLATTARIAIADEPDIHIAAQAQLHGPRSGGRRVFFTPVKIRIDKKENRKQGTGREKGLGPQGARGPKEIDPLKEAKEQGRIAKRRQHPANVRDKKNKEDHHMGVEGARAIGANERLDQDYRGASRSDYACDHGAKREDRCVDRRRAVEPALMPPAAVNSAKSMRMKGRYSSAMLCAKLAVAAGNHFDGDKASKRQDRPKPAALA